MFGKTFFSKSPIDDWCWQKFGGSNISCVAKSTGRLPSSIYKSCLANVWEESTMSKCIRILVDSVIFFTYLQRAELFSRAVSSHTGVILDWRGKVWWKTPANSIKALPNGCWLFQKSLKIRSSISRPFLWAMVNSSEIVSWHVFRAVAIPDVFLTSQTVCETRFKFNGSLRVECKVRALSSSVAAIPGDATATVIPWFIRLTSHKSNTVGYCRRSRTHPKDDSETCHHYFDLPRRKCPHRFMIRSNFCEYQIE